MKRSSEFLNRTIIDELLEEQGKLTAVEKFSRKHERHDIPLQQKYYRDLIPVGKPGKGEQFAFEVNLDACSGCKACVVACHSLNGLDEDETWRRVGTLIGKDIVEPFHQTVTSACHHCVDPGCLNGCPVEAYEKDATGIVRHLDDQCIGCQYCSMTCPYDVPQYSTKRGIVRKCDMCSSRLAVGEAPACVQACPDGAISVRIIKQSDMIARAEQNVFLPASPIPSITIPTTRYVSSKPIPTNVSATIEKNAKLEPAHFPLVFMLVLTQASAGIFTVEALLKLSGVAISTASVQMLRWTGLATAIIGIISSVLHLGRPMHAWRSFLGWRHSWLSREIIAFGIFASFASLTVLGDFLPLLQKFDLVLLVFAATSGVIAVYCSVMVYHVTKRDWWHWTFAGEKFFGTALLLGTAFLCIANGNGTGLRLGLVAVVMLSAFKLLAEWWLTRSSNSNAVRRTGQLVKNELRSIYLARTGITLVGGVVLSGLVLAGYLRPGFMIFGVSLCLIGELFERYLFFRAVAPPKMPGGG